MIESATRNTHECNRGNNTARGLAAVTIAQSVDNAAVTRIRIRYYTAVMWGGPTFRLVVHIYPQKTKSEMK